MSIIYLMSNIKYHKIYPIIFLFFFIVPNFALAEPLGYISKDTTIPAEELVRLPQWCQIRMQAHPRMHHTEGAEDVPETIMRENAKYAKIIGEDIYIFVHHYCRGLNWIKRYDRSIIFPYDGVEKDRDFALNYALSEFRFMRGRLKPRHKLYYEMLMKEAYVYWEKKDYKKSLRNYVEIMERNPSFAPVYVKYSELLNSVGEKEEAIKLLKTGLKKTRGDQHIKKKLKILEGLNAE